MWGRGNSDPEAAAAPSPAAPGKPPFARQAATCSWLAPLLVLGVNFYTLLSAGQSRVVSFVIVIVTCLLLPAGLILGIIALAGVKRHGRDGILQPAIAGVILSSLSLALVIFSFVVVFR